MSAKTILISGASAAGPTLGYWLARAGFAVTIVERAPALRTGGYAVDIRGAAIKVVEDMGLLAQIRAADTGIQGMYLVNKAGKELVKLSDGAPGNTSGSTSVEIMRSDLSQLLYYLAQSCCAYRWGDSIATLEQEETGVRVTFEQGETQYFDLVIGADGLHSNVRRLAFGEEAQFVHRLGRYICIFTVPNHLQLRHRQLVYQAPGKTVFLSSARQATEAKAFLLFRSPLLDYPRRDIGAQQALVAKAFAGETGWEVPRLLTDMAEAPDFYFDELAQVRMPSWHQGRIALVGDAAYCASPASGQGTSLALVGAYVLAGELCKTPDDHTAAFGRYQAAMQEFVQTNQALGVAMAEEMVVGSAWELWIRSHVVRIPGVVGFFSRQGDEAIKKAAEGIVLLDYFTAYE